MVMLPQTSREKDLRFPYKCTVKKRRSKLDLVGMKMMELVWSFSGVEALRL